jgi:predicted nucleic acid-binding protein
MQYTMTDVPPEVARVFDEMALREGRAVDELVLEALRRYAVCEDPTNLDFLIGTWDAASANWTSWRQNRTIRRCEPAPRYNRT